MIRIGLLAVVVAATLAGCAAQEGPAPAGSTSASPTSAALEDGRHMVFIKSLDDDSVTFDFVSLLTGEEAQAAYAEDHPGEMLDSDFYIVNDDPQLNTLPVAGDVLVSVVDIDQPSELVAIPFEDLEGYHQAPIDASPYWITVAAGVITQIEEQYLP